MIDAIASEAHFIDHLAPVWRALPEKGRFLVPESLMEHAERRGVQGTLMDMPVGRVRATINASGPPALVASYGDQKRGRLQGYGAFAFLEHGIGQSYGNRHGSYPGGSDREDVGLFLVPNEYAAEKWRASYPATVEVVGCPKLDDAPTYEPSDQPLVALSFHWDCYIAPEAMGAWGYYRKAIPLIARRYTLLGHGHPRILPTIEKHYRASGVEIVRDFAEVLRRAAVYVCDNSSSMYEFAATGRPVVTLNQPAYRRTVHHGLRFWEAANVGVQVDGPGGLEAAVELALADPPGVRANREAALDIVYAYRTGAARRAARALLRWLAAVE